MSETYDLLEIKEHIYNQYKSVKQYTSKVTEHSVSKYIYISQCQPVNKKNHFEHDTLESGSASSRKSSRMALIPVCRNLLRTISGLFLCIGTFVQSTLWIAVSIWITTSQHV
jgi:hypothetical protein